MSQPKHVLMLTSYLDDQSRETGFIVDWVEGLAKQVDWLTVCVLAKPRTSLNAQNVTIVELKGSNGLAKALSFFDQVTKIHQQQPVTQVFNHMYDFMGVLGGAWARLHQIPSVMWYAGGLRLRRYSLLHLAFILNNKIVTCAEDTIEKYQTVFHKKNVVNIGHAINIDRFKRQKHKRDITSKFEVGSIGRLSSEKNFENLIEAVNLAQESIKTKLKLHLVVAQVDSSQPYAEKIFGLVEKSKVEVLVHKEVPFEKIPSLLSNWDLYVHPGNVKAVDKAGLEAICSGVPVLLSRVSYGRALIKFPQVLLTSVESEALASKLVDISKNYNQAAAKQKQLQTYVREYYSLDNFMKRLVVELV